MYHLFPFKRKKFNTIFCFLSFHSFHLFLSTRNKKPLAWMVPFVVFTIDDQAGGGVRAATASSVSSPNILRGQWLRSVEPHSRTDPCCCVTWWDPNLPLSVCAISDLFMDQGIHRLIYHYLYHKEQVILVVNRPPFIAPSKNTSRGGQKYITLFSNTSGSARATRTWYLKKI
jgi:hypothetical protein